MSNPVIDLLKKYQLIDYVLSFESGSKLHFLSSRVERDLEWRLLVTDGGNVWSLTMGKTQVEAHQNKSSTNSLDNYFSKFRDSLRNSEVTIAIPVSTLELRLGNGDSSLVYQLEEVTHEEKQSDMASLLKCLTDQVASLHQRLQNSEEKHHRPSSFHQTLTDLDSHRKGGSPVKIKRREGMSIINPNSKKLKAPQGVNFD